MSIRNRVLLFSVLVTLVPSIGMGWLFYNMTYKAAAKKIERSLIDSAGRVEREMTFWLKERDNDLQVFAGSSTLIDNLTKYLAINGNEDSMAKDNQAASLKKIVAYLNNVKNQYDDFKRLAVFDGEGKEICTSDISGEEKPLSLPADWKARIATTKFLIGEVSFRADESAPLMMIGIPLRSNQLGVLVVEMRLQGLLPSLKAVHADGETGPWSIILVQKDGHPILSTASPEGQEETILTSNQKMRLFSNPFQLCNFDNGKWITGLAVPFKDLPWGLVMAESYDDVFAGVINMRDRIILTAILFALITGLCAFVVAGQIIPSLGSLMDGALQVANGDLDISLDIKRGDELGIVSGIFNEVAVRLRQNKQELEQQAVTDGLTNLANRKQILKTLNTSIDNFRRYDIEFSLLLIDIDQFRNVNDTYGHLVGDAVLAQMALIFNRVLRSLDVAGRYGGEEFLVILGKTDVQNAKLTAERIRQAVEQYLFVYQDAELRLTISTGVAGIMQKEDTDNNLIGRASSALSEAKSQGKNRVVLGAGVICSVAP